MRKNTIFLLFLTLSVHTFSQKDYKSIVTINGENVSVAEFKKVYEKSLDAIDNGEEKDVSKNLELYINYKLKVFEAYQLKLDTLKSYKREIKTYRNKLIASYLHDKDFLDTLIKEAYERTKTEIKASHILIRLPKNYKPEDTLKFYNKAIEARNRILKGEPFEKVAKEVSEDESALSNGGNLGYFSAFEMVYDFEDAAYNTRKGGVSMPFKTKFGYHIVQNNGFRNSLGKIEVAHILVKDTTNLGKKRIEEAYAKLKKGSDFKMLAKEYSDDKNSKNKGGILPRFGMGKMVKPFEKAAFSINKENEFSQPFKTVFGWHIVKLIKKYPVLSFDKMKKEIISKANRSGRAGLSDKAVLGRLKRQYKIVEPKSTKEFLKREKIRSISKDSLQAPALKINEKVISQADFVSYILNRKNLPVDILFKNFIDQEVLTYYKENLSKTNPEFVSTLKEYEDGLLLFELMQRKIWAKSNDSISLNQYFNTKKSNYKEKELSKIKGKVMSDYQLFLEKEWIKSLRAKSNIKVHKKILKRLTRYYEKES